MAYYVYIMANAGNNVLYVGMTNDIERRVAEHKSHSVPGFTQKYNVDKCVYVCEFKNVNDALENEKRIKAWRRSKKFDLIRSVNPEFQDLAEEMNDK